jgi:hypothetical protein
VAAIWLRERRPPSLGEAGELDEEVDLEGGVSSILPGFSLALSR